MAETLRVGIIGAGWPGQAHARGYKESGGFKLVAVADLIPDRRKKLMGEFGISKEFADGMELIADKELDVVSVCVPNHQHAAMSAAALKAGKHVLCEKPPALNAKEARRIQAAAVKAGKVILYANQRRFGGGEQAARQAIEKGYAGEVYHARASWMRTRGIPRGTGWYTDKSKSGGGVLCDLGVSVLDLAWSMLGQPKPLTAFGTVHRKFNSLTSEGVPFDVDDAVFAMIRFENGKSLELAVSWAINQPPTQQGTVCRLYGDAGAIEVYTADGAVIHRGFTERGESKATALKPPKVAGHTALIRHFRQCIMGQATPIVGGGEGVTIMEMIEAIYRSAESGKSVNV